MNAVAETILNTVSGSSLLVGMYCSLQRHILERGI